MADRLGHDATVAEAGQQAAALAQAETDLAAQPEDTTILAAAAAQVELAALQVR